MLNIKYLLIPSVILDNANTSSGEIVDFFCKTCSDNCIAILEKK
jgi:hypothetical protein